MDLQTAIIGDVHGCGIEFAELTQYLLESENIGRIVLTGDLFTKGATPHLLVRELDSLQQHGCEVIPVCGNHDLRLFSAQLRLKTGLPLQELPKTERRTSRLLEEHGCTDRAIRWLATAVDTVQWSDGHGTSVVHAGVDPELGLGGTSHYDKIHMKAQDGERHWWMDYDGRDGLIVVGHKPVGEPMCITHQDRPVVINIDTGCVLGGLLSAYLPGADRFIAVESRQIPRRIESRESQKSLSSVA
jgi:hypothetical protein